MTLAFYQLLALLAGTSRSDLRRQVQYLKAENEVLRSKLGTRVSVTPAERARLARLAKAVGPAIKSLVSIVSPGTVLRWINRSGRRARFNRPASSRPPVRPRTPAEIRTVILRMARETGWGYTRILGETRKLGLLVSRSTVANIVREAGISPVPSRGEPRWNDFVRAHARTRAVSSRIPGRMIHTPDARRTARPPLDNPFEHDWRLVETLLGRLSAARIA